VSGYQTNIKTEWEQSVMLRRHFFFLTQSTIFKHNKKLVSTNDFWKWTFSTPASQQAQLHPRRVVSTYLPFGEKEKILHRSSSKN
jgi:hypothetical protein